MVYANALKQHGLGCQNMAVIMGIKGFEAWQFTQVFNMQVVGIGWTWKGHRFQITLADLRECVHFLEEELVKLQRRMDARDAILQAFVDAAEMRTL